MTRGEQVEAAARAEALAFYADPANYGFYIDSIDGSLRSPRVNEDGGIKARSALSRTEQPEAPATEDAYHAALYCPACGTRHVDEGEWATRRHHKHLCAKCGFLWRVEPYTFGVPEQPATLPPCGHDGDTPGGDWFSETARTLVDGMNIIMLPGLRAARIGVIGAALQRAHAMGQRGHDGGGGVGMEPWCYVVVDADMRGWDGEYYKVKAAAEGTAEDANRQVEVPGRWRVVPLYAHPTPAASEGERSNDPAGGDECTRAFNRGRKYEREYGALVQSEGERDLMAAHLSNRCGDAACEEQRLAAAILVLTGGKTHREYAQAVLGLDDHPDHATAASEAGANKPGRVEALAKVLADANADYVEPRAGVEGKRFGVDMPERFCEMYRFMAARAIATMTPRASEGERATIERCAEVCDEELSALRWEMARALNPDAIVEWEGKIEAVERVRAAIRALAAERGERGSG